jgi:LPXTG-site transpeptidase (sortase) family protein
LCVFTAFIGGLLLIIGLVSKTNRKTTNLALVITGIVLIGVSLLTGITALNLNGEGSNTGQVSIVMGTETIQDSIAQATASPTINPLGALPAYLLATPRAFPTTVGTLPSYPIPSPTLVDTPQPGESGPDTSAVVRIVIPTLGVDAEVAYVPFDGQTWLIQGLREEVAWLGNTSWPGLGSNTALAGHITVAGLGDGPFRFLSDLIQNDEIRLYTEKNVYTYRVRERLVVEETEIWVTEPTENSQITLITCVEWSEKLQTYLKRLVVIADQVEVRQLAY